ncbi:MAG: hypothetical protein JXQ25_10045 [Deltaproteobacteria bacterium]|nr:hypothetical protein [Deltaproteobacteria bacterium]
MRILTERGKIGMVYPLSSAVTSVSSPADERKKEMSIAETSASQAQSEPIAVSFLDAPAPTSKNKNVSNPSSVQGKAPPEPVGRSDPESLPAGRGTGASWNSGYTRLANEISVRSGKRG